MIKYKPPRPKMLSTAVLNIKVNGKIYENVFSVTEETKNARKDKSFKNRVIIKYEKDGELLEETIYEPYTFSFIGD